MSDTLKQLHPGVPLTPRVSAVLFRGFMLGSSNAERKKKRKKRRMNMKVVHMAAPSPVPRLARSNVRPRIQHSSVPLGPQRGFGEVGGGSCFICDRSRPRQKD